MTDTTHFLFLVAALVCVLAALIYRVLTGRGQAKKRKYRIDDKSQTTVQALKDELDEHENDVVTNPVFSFLKTNLFHKNRHDD